MQRPQLVPPPKPRNIREGITLVEPISRRGTGPGLILLVNEESQGAWIIDGIPSPLQKWGEESYTVVEIIPVACRQPDAIATAISALQQSSCCDPKETLGIVAYDATLWNLVASQVSQQTALVGTVIYADASSLSKLTTINQPVLIHAAGKLETTIERTPRRIVHSYPDQSSLFASPKTPHFNYAAEAVSHTRSLTHLKKLMNGPYFDLEAFWDEHTYFEFEVRDVEATMCTMVQEPYVNHIPTATGGIGRKALTAFYTESFVFSNPKDTALELISRTVGIDRVVDEFVFKFTHDTMIPWIFPGIPPTGKFVEIPFMAVVNIRGDRLYHEHITWDHATALRQIGWLPTSLPYPGDSTTTNGINGHSNGHPSRLVLPVLGNETAAKLRDKNALPSNTLFTEAGVKML